MPLLPLVLALNVTLASLGTPPRAVAPEQMEDAVLAELNRARSDPSAFAYSLRTWREYYHDKLIVRPGARLIFATQEGVAPVDEAISFVERRPRTSSLTPAPVLSAAAADHQSEQAMTGAVGHGGSDGSSPADRVRRNGGGRYVGEVIAYGTDQPSDIVRQLVVDDGVSDRGHRRLLFDPSLRYAGVSCGSHPVYRYMCVITFGRTADAQPIRRVVALVNGHRSRQQLDN